jgi:hypothetical protein
MKKLINIISKAIDCPLMDTRNIPLEIADYLVHSIFYLQYEVEIYEYRKETTTGCFLATSKEHAWELYEEHSNNFNIEYMLEKDEFLKNLGEYSYGNYLTTQGCIRHLKVEWYDERDDFHMVEYEYKKPTRNVNKKKIAERVQNCNVWYHPMIDVMFDGVEEYKPLTILRRVSA